MISNKNKSGYTVGIEFSRYDRGIMSLYSRLLFDRGVRNSLGRKLTHGQLCYSIVKSFLDDIRAELINHPSGLTGDDSELVFRNDSKIASSDLTESNKSHHTGDLSEENDLGIVNHTSEEIVENNGCIKPLIESIDKCGIDLGKGDSDEH